MELVCDERVMALLLPKGAKNIRELVSLSVLWIAAHMCILKRSLFCAGYVLCMSVRVCSARGKCFRPLFAAIAVLAWCVCWRTVSRRQRTGFRRSSRGCVVALDFCLFVAPCTRCLCLCLRASQPSPCGCSDAFPHVTCFESPFLSRSAARSWRRLLSLPVAT